MAITDLIRGRQTATRTLTNKSGGGVVQGDVVVIGDGSNDNSFTTTTSAAFNTRMVGVAMETIANNAAGLVAISGYVPIVNSAAGLTRGHFLFTSTNAKEATGSGTRGAGAFGMVLESATDPEAIIWGMPDPTGTGSTPGTVLGSNSRATGTYSTTSATLADVDATNMAVTFTAPASGNVLVILSAYCDITATGSAFGRWSLREGSSDISGAGGSVTRGNGTSGDDGYRTIRIHLTGLSAGSHTYKWSFNVSVAGQTFRILAGAGGDAQPPATMEVIEEA